MAGFFEGVNSVDSFTTNFETWLALEEMTGRLANQFAVVYEKNVLCHRDPPNQVTANKLESTLRSVR